MDDDLKVSFRIPFPTKRTAEIVYEVLRIDEEPKRSRIKKVLSVEDNILNVDFSGEIPKNVRVGVTAFFDSLILCCETLDEFGPPASEEYSF